MVYFKKVFQSPLAGAWKISQWLIERNWSFEVDNQSKHGYIEWSVLGTHGGKLDDIPAQLEDLGFEEGDIVIQYTTQVSIPE